MEFIEHHMKIADEVNLPQILYNVPSRTASFIESKTVSKLAKHQNIIGIKDATGDMSNLSSLKVYVKKKLIVTIFLFSLETILPL